MPQQRPDAITPVTVDDMFAALADAWRRKFGADAPRRSLLVLLAQWAEETGRGHAMHCYNVGNIKGRPDGSDGRDWTFFRCDEVIGGKVVWFDPPHPACCFRAYVAFGLAVDDYLDELAKRFASAWPAVLAGDPVAFAQRLKAARYYTADAGAYGAALASLVREFNRTVPVDAPIAPNPQGGALLALADGVDAGREGLDELPPDTERDG